MEKGELEAGMKAAERMSMALVAHGPVKNEQFLVAIATLIAHTCRSFDDQEQVEQFLKAVLDVSRLMLLDGEFDTASMGNVVGEA